MKWVSGRAQRERGRALVRAVALELEAHPAPEDEVHLEGKPALARLAVRVQARGVRRRGLTHLDRARDGAALGGLWPAAGGV